MPTRRSGTPEYQAWRNMLARCSSKSGRVWRHYGARGISVCDRWRESFEAFFGDMGKRPSTWHSLDRVDSNGGYEPSNCRWATILEQSTNRSVRLDPIENRSEGSYLFRAWVDVTFLTHRAAAVDLGEPASAVSFWCAGRQRPGRLKRSKIQRRSMGFVPVYSWWSDIERAAVGPDMIPWSPLALSIKHASVDAHMIADVAIHTGVR